MLHHSRVLVSKFHRFYLYDFHLQLQETAIVTTLLELQFFELYRN